MLFGPPIGDRLLGRHAGEQEMGFFFSLGSKGAFNYSELRF
jgi:hypothetical protein